MNHQTNNDNLTMKSKKYSLLDPLLISFQGSRLFDVPVKLSAVDTLAFIEEQLNDEKQMIRYFDVRRSHHRSVPPSLTTDEMRQNCRSVAYQLVNQFEEDESPYRRAEEKVEKHWSENITQFSLNDLSPPEPRRHSAVEQSRGVGEDQPPYPLHRTMNFCATPFTPHHLYPYAQYPVYSNASPTLQTQTHGVNVKKRKVLHCQQNDTILAVIDLEMLGIPKEHLRSTLGPLEYSLEVSYVEENYAEMPFSVEYGLGFFASSNFYFKRISQANRDFRDIVEETDKRAIDEKIIMVEVHVRDYIFSYDSTPMLGVRIYPHIDRLVILSVDVKIRV